MKNIVFQVGGALGAEHMNAYIERQADTDVLNALTNLRAMDYLLIIEPRQQGKTSLISHLIDQHMLRGNTVFVYLDLEDFDCGNEQCWCADIWNELIQQCSMLSNLAGIPVPTRVREWREQMECLAARAHQAQRRLVIVLDEIENIQRNQDQTWSRTFFAAIRKLYNLRRVRPSLNSLTFMLVGVFHPRDLIPDGVTSPFNIAHRVRLADFGLEQVQELVSKGSWSKGQVTALVPRIHYWTGGQPYLTQVLCSYLGPDATSPDVDSAVKRLRREDENHLLPMLERLNGDNKLPQYVNRILAGERIEFYPQENRQQSQLELLGLIKADAEGCCTVRNRIYELVLQHQSITRGDSPSIVLSSPLLSRELARERRKRSRTVPSPTMDAATSASPRPAVTVAKPSPVPVEPVPRTPSPTVQPADSLLAATRDLLLAAFTAEDLRRLVLYTSSPALRPLANEFGPSDGLATAVEKIVTYCWKRDLLPALLNEVKADNPSQYARFAPRLNM